MASWVWIAVAMVGLGLAGLGLRAFILGGFVGGRSAPEADDGVVDAPMPLQHKRAWWGLGIAGAAAAALGAIVAVVGPAGYWQNREARLLGWAVLPAGGLAYAAMLWVTRARSPRSSTAIDERDRAIMTRALSVALVAGFLTLVAWTIGLTEADWDEKAVPIDYPSFVLWSSVLVAVLGREVGILMGYAGWHGHGEG
jgi:hypothetical protein